MKETVNYKNQNLVSFIYTFLSLLGLWMQKTLGATILMLGLAGMYMYIFPPYRNIIITSFLIGFFSDILLNVYAHLQRNKMGIRSAKLRYYFMKEGTIKAAAFAGALVVWMTLASLIFIDDDDQNGWGLIYIGFFVGAFLGIFAEESKAIQNLKPFYDSTSGQMENRIWDGLSMSWVFIVIVALNKALPSLLEVKKSEEKELPYLS